MIKIYSYDNLGYIDHDYMIKLVIGITIKIMSHTSSKIITLKNLVKKLTLMKYSEQNLKLLQLSQNAAINLITAKNFNNSHFNEVI